MPTVRWSEVVSGCRGPLTTCSHMSISGRIRSTKGSSTATQGPGVAVLLPFVDRMRPLIDMREQVVSGPRQPLTTSDHLTVGIDTGIALHVTHPRAATSAVQH